MRFHHPLLLHRYKCILMPSVKCFGDAGVILKNDTQSRDHWKAKRCLLSQLFHHSIPTTLPLELLLLCRVMILCGVAGKQRATEVHLLMRYCHVTIWCTISVSFVNAFTMLWRQAMGKVLVKVIAKMHMPHLLLETHQVGEAAMLRIAYN